MNIQISRYVTCHVLLTSCMYVRAINKLNYRLYFVYYVQTSLAPCPTLSARQGTPTGFISLVLLNFRQYVRACAHYKVGDVTTRTQSFSIKESVRVTL